MHASAIVSNPKTWPHGYVKCHENKQVNWTCKPNYGIKH